MHRDVRWANVIFLPAEMRWLLVDLEHVGLNNCDCRYGRGAKGCTIDAPEQRSMGLQTCVTETVGGCYT